MRALARDVLGEFLGAGSHRHLGRRVQLVDHRLVVGDRDDVGADALA